MSESQPTPAGVSRWIAWRYLFAARHQYARFIAWVSSVGIGLGVAVLIVVLSVMNGFDRELSTRILGSVPHIVLSPQVTSDELPAIVGEQPEVVAAFPFYQGQAMLTQAGSVMPLAVYAFDPASADAVPMLAEAASDRLETLLATPRSLVLGAPVARRFGLLPGDPVVLMMSRLDNGRVRPQLLRFRLSGTFELDAELDFSLALMRLADVQGAEFAGTGAFGTRLVLTDPYAVATVTPRLTEGLGADWTVTDWSQSYGELFAAVRLEKSMMFLLLVLIIGIAAFNVVAGQAMLVNDKRGDIAILRTMGADDRALLRVFLLQGALTALAGVAFGVLLGLLLTYNIAALVGFFEQFLGLRFLDGTYFDEVPVALEITDVLVVVVIALGMSALAAMLPALRALTATPVAALHEV